MLAVNCGTKVRGKVSKHFLDLQQESLKQISLVLMLEIVDNGNKNYIDIPDR